jgi:hypothetical protein
VATSQGTTSTSYTDLATKGPEVTVPIPSSGNALVTVTAQAAVNSEGQSAAMGFAVSGMSTVIASDNKAFIVPFYSFGNPANPNLKAQASATYLVTGLVMGSNTFTAKYRVTVGKKGGEATWQNRSIIVIPLP